MPGACANCASQSAAAFSIPGFAHTHTEISAALLSPSHCRENAEKDCLGMGGRMNGLEEGQEGENPKERNLEKQKGSKGMTR